jgi:hypothetical protein
VIDLPAAKRAFEQGGKGNMSEQERDKRFETDDDSDDVEAHKKADRGRNDEGEDDGGDDVEAHVRSHRNG